MKKGSLFSILLITLLVVGGLFIILQSKNQQTPLDSRGAQTKTQQTTVPQIIAGKNSPYLEFTKIQYDKALASDKLIFLNFYADWCPICRAELPQIKNAFNSLDTDRVIGFQVNYNDASSDQDEKNLAKELQVSYQHTKVIIKNGQKVFGPAIEEWDEKKLLDTLNGYL